MNNGFLDSHIVFGKVFHERLFPLIHRFIYPLNFLEINLSEFLDHNFNSLLLKKNKFGVLSIYEKDYLGQSAGNLIEKLKSIVGEDLLNCDSVSLITCPRIFGYVFNPVSFFIFKRGHKITSLVAHVNNTFGESSIYFLNDPVDVEDSSDKTFFKTKKTFYVSPFFDNQYDYNFSVKSTDHECYVGVNLSKDDNLIFTSGMKGVKSKLSNFNIIKYLFYFFGSSLLNFPRILIQGCLLWIKGLKIYPKPKLQKHSFFRKISMIDNIFQFVFLKFVRSLTKGTIKIQLPNKRVVYNKQNHDSSSVDLVVHHPSFFKKIFFGGDIGFGESYVDGDWSSSDPVKLLDFFEKNFERINSIYASGSLFKKPFEVIKNYLNKNTITQSKKNIFAHYDLGNSFFKLFLDDSMTYSSAIFPDNNFSVDLYSAQLNKIDLVIQNLSLKTNSKIVEIGSGWGQLSVSAAKLGHSIDTTTISDQQFEYVNTLIQDNNLSEKITIIKEDYRNLSGQYDGVVSVEMIEAVGKEFLKEYFETSFRLLKPEKYFSLQSIVIKDEYSEDYSKGCDWIQKHIFPGGYLPSPSEIKMIAEEVGFSVESVQSYGIHYAETLLKWRMNFMNNIDLVRRLGFNQEFINKWLYYLIYCEAGFRSGHIDLNIYKFKKN